MGRDEAAESGCGVVAREDSGGLAAGIANLLRSNEELKAMGAAGANFARTQLNWRRIAQLFQAMYSEICEHDERAERYDRSILVPP